MSDLANPLSQPQRFIQQADALMRHAMAHPGAPDPVSQIDQHLEASFASALEQATRQQEPVAPPQPEVAHPMTAVPGFVPPIGDASVAPFQGVLGAGGPLMTYGSYAPVNITGIPSASFPAPSVGESGPTGSRHMGPELEGLIGEMSTKYAVPDWIVRNVIRQESGGNPSATSPVGAQGLMQLMPGTARELGVSNPYDPRQNVEGGVKYLRQLLDMFQGDHTKAVAAYNAGPAAVQRYGGVPPFAETQNYVNRVLR